MELPPTLPQRGATLTLTGPRSEGLALRDGQQVQAVVRAVGRDGNLLLQLNGRQLETKSDLALLPGQRLKLAVEQKAGQVTLRLLDKPAGADALGRALRSILPRQEPLARLTAALGRLGGDASLPEAASEPVQRLRAELPTLERVANPETLKRAVLDSGLFTENKLAHQSANTLGSDLKVALLRVAAALRAAARETPEQADKQAGRRGAPETGARQGGRAGPTEPGVRQGPRLGTPETGTGRPATPGTGRPATPGQAAPQGGRGNAPETAGRPPSVRPTAAPPPASAAGQAGKAPPAQTATPPQTVQGMLSEAGLDFLRQVESALARVQLHQITSLPSQETQEPQWIVELPLYSEEEEEGLRLRMRREGGSDEEGGPRWSVTLEYDSAQHGPVHMVVTLASGQVSVTFWSERPETAGLFHDNLDTLQARLRAAGLEVADVSSRRGLPQQEEPGTDARGLLDLTV